MAVSLSLANDDAGLPVAYRLYLPQSWVKDAERWAKVGCAQGRGLQDKAKERPQSQVCRRRENDDDRLGTGHTCHVAVGEFWPRTPPSVRTRSCR